MQCFYNRQVNKNQSNISNKPGDDSTFGNIRSFLWFQLRGLHSYVCTMRSSACRQFFGKLGTSDLSRGHLHHLPRLLHRGVWARGSVFHNNAVFHESGRQWHKMISFCSSTRHCSKWPCLTNWSVECLQLKKHPYSNVQAAITLM